MLCGGDTKDVAMLTLFHRGVFIVLENDDWFRFTNFSNDVPSAKLANHQ